MTTSDGIDDGPPEGDRTQPGARVVAAALLVEDGGAAIAAVLREFGVDAVLVRRSPPGQERMHLASGYRPVARYDVLTAAADRDPANEVLTAFEQVVHPDPVAEGSATAAEIEAGLEEPGLLPVEEVPPLHPSRVLREFARMLGSALRSVGLLLRR
ncbi:MAG: hypothetical protein AB7O97_22620 [Planctomycetota bacterium]